MIFRDMKNMWIVVVVSFAQCRMFKTFKYRIIILCVISGASVCPHAAAIKHESCYTTHEFISNMRKCIKCYIRKWLGVMGAGQWECTKWGEREEEKRLSAYFIDKLWPQLCELLWLTEWERWFSHVCVRPCVQCYCACSCVCVSVCVGSFGQI